MRCDFMIDFHAAQEFFQANRNAKYYVGFLKSPKVWFPLAMLSAPAEKQRLDTLFVSRSCLAMTEVVKSYASRIEDVEQTFVQFLVVAEIEGLMERYGLEQVAVISGEYEGEAMGGDGCGGDCACGCGCG
jgi:hypothetical protein